MSILIDKIINGNYPSTEIDGTWYRAKPEMGFTLGRKLKQFKDALRVFSGKSFAVHYYSDK